MHLGHFLTLLPRGCICPHLPLQATLAQAALCSPARDLPVRARPRPPADLTDLTFRGTPPSAKTPAPQTTVPCYELPALSLPDGKQDFCIHSVGPHSLSDSHFDLGFRNNCSEGTGSEVSQSMVQTVLSVLSSHKITKAKTNTPNPSKSQLN